MRFETQRLEWCDECENFQSHVEHLFNNRGFYMGSVETCAHADLCQYLSGVVNKMSEGLEQLAKEAVLG